MNHTSAVETLCTAFGALLLPFLAQDEVNTLWTPLPGQLVELWIFRLCCHRLDFLDKLLSLSNLYERVNMY